MIESISIICELEFEPDYEKVLKNNFGIACNLISWVKCAAVMCLLLGHNKLLQSEMILEKNSMEFY